MSAAVRRATVADAEAIASLLTQLGYPATPDEVRARIHASEEVASRAVMVGVLDGAVAGLAVGEVAETFHRPAPVARLALLVTDERARGKGVGTTLVRWFEGWARGRGATRATLESALHREKAHGFYRARGWEATGLRFVRELAG